MSYKWKKIDLKNEKLKHSARHSTKRMTRVISRKWCWLLQLKSRCKKAHIGGWGTNSPPARGQIHICDTSKVSNGQIPRCQAHMWSLVMSYPRETQEVFSTDTGIQGRKQGKLRKHIYSGWLNLAPKLKSNIHSLKLKHFSNHIYIRDILVENTEIDICSWFSLFFI